MPSHSPPLPLGHSGSTPPFLTPRVPNPPALANAPDPSPNHCPLPLHTDSPSLPFSSALSVASRRQGGDSSTEPRRRGTDAHLTDPLTSTTTSSTAPLVRAAHNLRLDDRLRATTPRDPLPSSSASPPIFPRLSLHNRHHQSPPSTVVPSAASSTAAAPFSTRSLSTASSLGHRRSLTLLHTATDSGTRPDQR
uniref:Uncharacterized protein n=1 Tax=Oryza punctata TaxID=4537 RepID=A0A0E0JKC2_ORYPU